ncbi:MAG: pilin [Candidatus Contendobacter sp.]|nr:pilin [Candidatus Contendobacter sp.]
MNNHPHYLIGFVATLACLAGVVLGRGALAAPPNADPPCFDNGNRYVDCRNGTVTDTVTGLIWLKRADCLEARDYAAANAQAAALQERRCGLRDGSSKGDWRLPTDAEWRATLGPLGGLGSTPFVGVQAAPYWSVTTNVDRPDTAWVADLQMGAVLTEGKTSLHFGWPVRGHLTASTMPVSQSAAIRAEVNTGLALATPVQTVVTEYFLDQGTVPANRAAVGLEDTISGPYVQSVEIVNGRIDILYGNGANAQIAGRVLSLTLYSDGATITWRCGNGPEPSSTRVSAPNITDVDNLYLPAQCQP